MTTGKWKSGIAFGAVAVFLTLGAGTGVAQWQPVVPGQAAPAPGVLPGVQSEALPGAVPGGDVLSQWEATEQRCLHRLDRAEAALSARRAASQWQAGGVEVGPDGAATMNDLLPAVPADVTRTLNAAVDRVRSCWEERGAIVRIWNKQATPAFFASLSPEQSRLIHSRIVADEILHEKMKSFADRLNDFARGELAE